MKKRLFFFLCAVMLCSAQMWGQETWNLTPTMTVALDANGVLTVSTTLEAEAMPNYPFNSVDMPWYEVRLTIHSIVIKDNVTTIGETAFRQCDNLTSISIPNTVTSIGLYAFYECFSLSSITIPNSVKTIGAMAFWQCQGITSITIPYSVTSIDIGAFQGCYNITSVTVEWKSPLNVLSNIFYDDTYTPKDLSKVTLHVPAGTKTLYQAADVWKDFGQIVEDGTLSNDIVWQLTPTMTAVLDANGALTISTIKVEGEAMPDYQSTADRPWDKFTIGSVVVKDRVTAIGSDAFLYCSSLQSITIPLSVNNIGFGAFWFCKGLTDVTVEWTTPLSVPNNTFFNVNLSAATLHVPAGTKAFYQSVNVWKDFGTIVEYELDVVPYLFLQKTDGNLLEILFTDSEIQMQDDLFLVKTPSQQYTFNYGEINNFYFKLMNKIVTSIEETLSPSSVKIYLDGESNLHISGSKPLGNIAIYGITGPLLKKVVTGNTDITINISGFAKGIYFVKTYEKTVKIIK